MLRGGVSHTLCEADCVYGGNTMLNGRIRYSGSCCQLTVVQFRFKHYVVRFGKVNDTKDIFVKNLILKII